MSAKRKPMTVADISVAREGGVADPHADVDVPVPEKASGQRAHVKQLTLYLPHPVYRQLRELAFHEEKRMHGLVMEGLDRLFEDRGRPSVKQLTRPR